MGALTARLKRLEARAPQSLTTTPPWLAGVLLDPVVGPLFLEVANHVQGFWHPPDPEMPAKIRLVTQRLREMGLAP